MKEQLWLTMGGVEYWLEGGTYDDLMTATRSMLKSKFDHRSEKALTSYSAAQTAAMLQPYRLFRVVDLERGTGELVKPGEQS